MNKQIKKVLPPVKKQQSQLNPLYILILIIYVILSVFTPNFYTLDSSATKFLALALLNLFSLLVFFFDKDYRKREELHWGFFYSYSGIAYLFFILISLISFLNAINLTESLMNIVKIFTVFTSTYVFYVIIKKNHGYLQYVFIAFTILLLIDCITVFYGIIKYIAGEIPSIYEIKSMYSNKNILASALFVKLPIAIFLMYFSNGWKKKLGYLAVFFTMLSILFMSARAFYLGLFIVLIALILYAILRGIKIKEKKAYSSIILFSGLLLGAVFIFYFTQHYLYPKKNDIYNKSLVSRLSTISTNEATADIRLILWKQSAQLIKEHPVLGVGSGNWKLVILKYENKTSTNFFLSYKNHNDFIEITAETGIFGGLAYLAIFFFIFTGFIRTFKNKETDADNSHQLMFLAALGILAYSVDAFFNFPIDRPEMQLLFAFYVAAGIALNTGKIKSFLFIEKISKYINPKFIVSFLLVILCVITYLLSMNVKSSRYQRYYLEDKRRDIYTKSADFMVAGFPSMPNISCINEPIVSNIAYYLIHDGKNQQAIDLLMKDNSSPYDSRREYYLSVAYAEMGIMDSAIVWGKKACILKPLEYNTNRNLSIMMMYGGLNKEAMQLTSEYAQKLKNSSAAWLLAANTHWECGQKMPAIQLLDTAIIYLPNDTAVLTQLKQMKHFIKFIPYDSIYNQAVSVLNNQDFTEAIHLFSVFIDKKPEIADAYQQRAVCYYNLKDYTKSLVDIEKAIKIGMEPDAPLFNLRGLIKLGLGKNDDACSDFKIAMEKGDNDGISNHQRFCMQK
jgi:putative inorganic carbon (hco3(-)) transporter